MRLVSSSPFLEIFAVNHPLLAVRIKIGRAKRHLTELDAAIRQYHAIPPYRIVIDKETEPGEELHCFYFVEPIPDCLGGIVGDIVHNLRASLDNLATALAIQNGANGRHTKFPIGATKEDFERNVTPYLKGVPAQAKKIIKRLKPYKGGNTVFWRLHQLDILDKHTVIIPVGVANSAVNIQFNWLPGWFKEGEVVPKAPRFSLGTKPRHLKDGDILPQLKFQAAGHTIDGVQTQFSEGETKSNFDFTFSISFGESQIIDGDPVVPTLNQFIDFIERVVGIFERKFFP